MWAAEGSDGELHAHRAIRSPITGGDGNVEFLVDIRRQGGDEMEMAGYIESVAEAVG